MSAGPNPQHKSIERASYPTPEPMDPVKVVQTIDWRVRQLQAHRSRAKKPCCGRRESPSVTGLDAEIRALNWVRSLLDPASQVTDSDESERTGEKTGPETAGSEE